VYAFCLPVLAELTALTPPIGQADVRAFSLGPSPAGAEGEGTAEEAAGPAPAGLPETQAAAEAPGPAAGPEEAPLVEGAAAGPAPEVRKFESGTGSVWATFGLFIIYSVARAPRTWPRVFSERVGCLLADLTGAYL
jgi:hypothetical protein